VLPQQRTADIELVSAGAKQVKKDQHGNEQAQGETQRRQHRHRNAPR
jgi:hypothetical protein